MKTYIRPEIEMNEVEAKDVITASNWLGEAIEVITGGNKDLNISEGVDESGNSSVTVSGNAGWFV